jgi:hypothetical protein
MRMDISWWDLNQSAQTIDSLREHLRNGGAEPWAGVPGLSLKIWMADRVHNQWGAVMLWESSRPSDGTLPPNLAAGLIGCPPAHRSRFEVEATVEGLHSLARLHGLGPAFA